MAQNAITVFEAVNEKLREFYIGATEKFLDALAIEHEIAPPAKIAHWRREHEFFYRNVASLDSPEEAKQFVANYAKAMAGTGWKVLTDS